MRPGGLLGGNRWLQRYGPQQSCCPRAVSQGLRQLIYFLFRQSGRCNLGVKHRNPVIHVLGNQSAVIPNDADYRDINVGEDIGRSAKDSQHAHDQNENGQNHESVGSA